MWLKKHTFYWLHAIIIIVGLYICGTMIYGVVSGTDRGHPAAIVFMPLVIVVWLFLHIFLGFIQWLKNRGNKNTLKQGNTKKSWPPLLVIFVILCSIASLIGFAGLANMLYEGRMPRYSSQWLMFLVDGVSFVCLCGILLRKNWGRLMAGAACILLSGFIMYVTTTRLVTRGFDGNSFYAVLMVMALGYFGYHFLTSERIKSFINN